MKTVLRLLLALCLVFVTAPLTSCQSVKDGSTTVQKYVKPGTVQLATQLLVAKQLSGAKTLDSYNKKVGQWQTIAVTVDNVNVNGVSFADAKALLLAKFAKDDPEKALLVSLVLDFVPESVTGATTGAINDPYLTAVSKGVADAVRLSTPPASK